MKILLVTEKFSPDKNQQDGGARLIETLKQGLGNKLAIMQFGGKIGSSANWSFDYPINSDNRFEKRIANAEFIAKQVKSIEKQFTHIIFVHISMQFGFTKILLHDKIETWTFPMFLTPSYEISGENVPTQYTEMEKLTLSGTKNILTPSYFEKKQLRDYYSVPELKVHVVPRGVNLVLLNPIIRTLEGEKLPIFCSIGSIKPQKNTLGLIDLFLELKSKFPKSILRIIGPVQNQKYYDTVIARINKLNLSKSIELTGHIPPDKLSSVIADCHMHISTSTCETFGRSIFETLASGIPGIARLYNNAASEFLQGLPYIKFTHDNNHALQVIDEILGNFQRLSEMAIEIGGLYNDKMLAKLLAAKICGKEAVAISDYDGTLFHKNNHGKTIACVEGFKKFSTRIICSARSTEDLLAEMKLYNLQVDWIIAYSGAVATDGNGNLLWINSLSQKDINRLINLFPNHEKIIVKDEVIQISTPAKLPLNILELNIEIYKDRAFFSSWQASKLRAICRLLNHINWCGIVKAFGDGKYDKEFLTYFDGHLVKAEDNAGFLKQI